MVLEACETRLGMKFHETRVDRFRGPVSVGMCRQETGAFFDKSVDGKSHVRRGEPLLGLATQADSSVCGISKIES